MALNRSPVHKWSYFVSMALGRCSFGQKQWGEVGGGRGQGLVHQLSTILVHFYYLLDFRNLGKIMWSSGQEPILTPVPWKEQL